MLRYAESNDCRMAALVRHFGDFADGQKPCGLCDFCAPSECIGQQFRPATDEERAVALRVLAALRSEKGKSTGKLHTELNPRGEMIRDDFEELLGSLARAGLVRLTDAVFEKDGKTIPYRKASLTRAAADAADAGEMATVELLIKTEAAPVARRRKGKKKAAGHAKRTRPPLKSSAPVKVAARVANPRVDTQVDNTRVEDALRRWRMAEAKRRGVPAFRIFSDQALKAVAVKRPETAAELIAIPGIGISTVEKYGAQIYRLLHESRL
jgi:superfamily II DNA helicase RecQ